MASGFDELLKQCRFPMRLLDSPLPLPLRPVFVSPGGMASTSMGLPMEFDEAPPEP
jgi:hypothetical protein